MLISFSEYTDVDAFATVLHKMSGYVFDFIMEDGTVRPNCIPISPVYTNGTYMKCIQQDANGREIHHPFLIDLHQVKEAKYL